MERWSRVLLGLSLMLSIGVSFPLSPQAFGQTSQTEGLLWSSDIRLTTTANNSYSPKVAAVNGLAHVVWSEKISDSNYEIFYKSSSDDGATWSASNQISSTPYESTHPSIGVVGSYVYIIWSDYLQGPTYWQKGIVFVSSSNSGATWNSPVNLELSSTGAYEPVLAADSNSIYVCWTDFRDGVSRIYFKVSTNNGATWGSDMAISTLGVAATHSSITASGGTLNIVWTAPDPTTGYSAVWSTRSTNGGQSFSTPVKLSTSPVETATPNIDSSGQYVFVAWSDARNGPGWEIYGKESSNGGASWSPDIRLSNNPANSLEPSVAVAGSSVYVVWRDHRDGNAEIYFISSSNLGASWGAETRLTFDPNASYEPDIAVDSPYLYIVWEDNRDGNWEVFERTLTFYPFDFRLYNSGSSSNLGGIAVAHRSSGSITITVSLVNGVAQTVTLSCNQANGSPLPSGVSCSSASGIPPFIATLTVTVSSSTTPGYYTIKVTGTAGSLTRITLFTLYVT
jgi:hypothetical protein